MLENEIKRRSFLHGAGVLSRKVISEAVLTSAYQIAKDLWEHDEADNDVDEWKDGELQLTVTDFGDLGRPAEFCIYRGKKECRSFSTFDALKFEPGNPIGDLASSLFKIHETEVSFNASNIQSNSPAKLDDLYRELERLDESLTDQQSLNEIEAQLSSQEPRHFYEFKVEEHEKLFPDSSGTYFGRGFNAFECRKDEDNSGCYQRYVLIDIEGSEESLRDLLNRVDGEYDEDKKFLHQLFYS